MQASALPKLSSGKVYGEKKPKSLWEKICEEFAAQRAEIEEQDIDDTASTAATDVTQFSASRHTPVVYGKMVHIAHVDTNIAAEFDPATSHPAAVGLSLLDRPQAKPASPPPPPNPKACSASEYLEAYVFPTLIPAMIAMLEQAKLERCFKRKRTKFNACDFLTEHLYKNNPQSKSTARDGMTLWDISFVKDHLVDNPRPPLPLSLLWSDAVGATKIQAYWRGYLVRTRPDVQELRQWQREWREENTDVRQQVNEFWQQKENKESSDASKETKSEKPQTSPDRSHKSSAASGRKSTSSVK